MNNLISQWKELYKIYPEGAIGVLIGGSLFAIWFVIILGCMIFCK